MYGWYRSFRQGRLPLTMYDRYAGLIPSSLAICLSDITRLLLALYLFPYRLFKPLPYLLTRISGRLACGNCFSGVHPDYEVGLAACSRPACSRSDALVYFWQCQK